MCVLARGGGIERYRDWKEVDHHGLIREGGTALLHRHGSLYRILESLFPSFQWNKQNTWKHSTGYWSSAPHGRQFLDEVGLAHSIHTAPQWRNIGAQEVVSQQGAALLDLHHWNLTALLSHLYPEFRTLSHRLRWIHPNGHWRDPLNRRAFLERVGVEGRWETALDVHSMGKQQVRDEGGRGLLSYFGRLQEVLRQGYPEFPLQIHSLPKLPHQFWATQRDNPRWTSLINSFHIQSPKDWYRVSRLQIEEEIGKRVSGEGLLEQLKVVFPEERWVEERMGRRNKKARQYWLFLKVREMFPGEDVEEEVSIEKVYRKSDRLVQVDVYVPWRRLAFEYQGEQHYENLGHQHYELGAQRMRDAEKEELCRRNGIKLVLVPYWWDRTVETLKKFIKN